MRFQKNFLNDFMEFWNDNVTEKSWLKLVSMRNTLKFVVIGGWSVYLYTKLHKSKDIDIIVDYETLRLLQSEYTLNKNDRLKKYEIKLDEFDIDIYLPGYSKLTVPVKDVIANTTLREGFNVPRPEFLLLLKTGAFIDRKDSIKGEKDSIDLVGLIFYADIDFALLKRLIDRYELEGYARTLAETVKRFDVNLAKYLNLNENGLSKLKKRYYEQLVSIQ